MGHYEPAVRYSVAVADDHADLRELIALRLSSVASLNVVGQASNGVEAISLARDQRPDLMTLDLQMPVMGGAEAIPVLRAVAPNMRIVVFSADPAAAELTKRNRPDAAVTKGSSLSDLVAIVVGLLAEGPPLDLVEVDLGRFPVHVAMAAFDGWIGLNSRVRAALATEGDYSAELLGNIPIEPLGPSLPHGRLHATGNAPDGGQLEWVDHSRRQVLRAPRLRRCGEASPTRSGRKWNASRLQQGLVAPPNTCG